MRSNLPPHQPHETEHCHGQSTHCRNSGDNWPHEGGRSNCAAWGKTCKACKTTGHFVKACRSTRKFVQALNQDCATSSEEEHVFVTTKSSSTSLSPRAVVVVVKIPVTFMIDIGATVSIVGENDLKNCRPNTIMKRTSVQVFPYRATSPLQLLGKVSVCTAYKEAFKKTSLSPQV